MKYTERAEFLIDNLNLPGATGMDDARWEEFQIAHLCDNSTFRIELKSRQIAWSWTGAAEAVANACLYGISSQFQSINLEEATEKIRYARAVYENLEVGGLPKITQPDTTTGLGFSNGARILSAPGVPQRGKARFWLYFDEWAHQQYGRANYTAAVPIISKGGRIRGGSSPMGAGGLFWEIFTQSTEKKYPGYSRKLTPWWEVRALCLDVAKARINAPTMLTADRVDLFGNDRLKAIYANMPEDDFRQEYECAFLDESTAWITWEEIRQCQQLGEGLAYITASGVDACMQAIDDLLAMKRERRSEEFFGLGMDIGRTRNTTEIFLVGISPAGNYPLRACLTLDNVDFDNQLAVLTYALRRLPIVKGLLDQSGIGRNLAEKAMKLFPSKVEGVDFTLASKTAWATEVKMLVQQKRTPIPTLRDLAYQIHAIKRIVTDAKNVIFDSDRNEKHHADKFWAWALSLAAVKTDGSRKIARTR